jgi:hypothetical protein
MSEENEQATSSDVPTTGHLKIPLWVKLMWLGFVLWLIWYVVFGLQSQPTTWA